MNNQTWWMKEIDDVTARKGKFSSRAIFFRRKMRIGIHIEINQNIFIRATLLLEISLDALIFYHVNTLDTSESKVIFQENIIVTKITIYIIQLMFGT